MDDLEFDLTWIEWVETNNSTMNMMWDDLEFDMTWIENADNTDSGAEGDDLSESGQETIEEDVTIEEEASIEDVETTDEALSEIDRILKELDEWNEESSEAIDETQKIIDSLKWVEWSEEAVTLLTWLQSENSQQKAQLEWLKWLINKLNKDKSELSIKNAELELYGWIDDSQLVYLNWNLSSARSWDEKAKDKIVSILDQLRTELAWTTLDQDNKESMEDKLNMFSSYNESKADPNTNVELMKWFSLELD